MALTAVGFTGTVNAVQDAKRSQYQGAMYPEVGGQPDFAVTTNNAADRTVDIAAGVAWAHGVMVTNTATATVQLDIVSTAGQTRWDAIVLRRDWSGSGSVSLTKVNGTAAAGAPMVVPTLNDSPGVLHDQLLAMVQVTNGSTLPTSIDPRRAWGTKVFTVPTVSALPSPSFTLYGAEFVLVDGSRYRCLLDASNNPAWVASGSGRNRELTTGIFVSGSIATGWGVADLTNKALVNDTTGDIQLDLQFRRSGATITPNATHGDIDPDVTVAQLVAALAPTQQTTPATMQYAISTGSPAFSCQVVIDTAGVISLRNGTAGAPLATRAAGDVSLRGCIRYTRKVA